MKRPLKRCLLAISENLRKRHKMTAYFQDNIARQFDVRGAKLKLKSCKKNHEKIRARLLLILCSDVEKINMLEEKYRPMTSQVTRKLREIT